MTPPREIRKHAEAIEKQVATGEKKLGKMIADAKQALLALNVELRDEALERVSPIELGMSCPDMMLSTKSALGGESNVDAVEVGDQVVQKQKRDQLAVSAYDCPLCG